MDNKFTPEVESKLQYYVYALVNPHADPVFYVGKGAGNHVFQHIAEAENKNACGTSEKLDQIRAIHATLDADDKPLEVKHFIIRYGLTEEVAFEIESTLIDFLTYPQFPSKTYDELTSLHKDLVGKHIVVAKGYQNPVKYTNTIKVVLISACFNV